MFIQQVKDKYQILAAKTPDFSTSFDETQYKEFLDTYKLHNEVSQGKLTKKVQKDLARTYTLFTSRKPAEDYLKGAKESWKAGFGEVIKKVATKMGIHPRGVKIETDFNYDLKNSSHNSSVITVSYKGKSEEFSIMEGSYDVDAQMGDAASNWSWAAWLGIEDSPFFDQDWKDAYIETEIAHTISELGSYFDESSIKQDLETWLKDALNG